MDGKVLGDIKLKRKDQAKTFAVMKKTISVENKTLEQLVQRLLAYIKCGRSTSDVFSYELSAVAPSLFHDNGQMRKNEKSQLLTEMIKLGELEDVHVPAYHIFDGCAWLYNTFWPKNGTMYHVCHNYLQTVRGDSNNAAGITIIFDNYLVHSTKEQEQEQRKSSKKSNHAELDLKISTPVPGDKLDILSNKANKQKLIDLISVVLVNAGISVKHAVEDGDADIMIMKQAIERSCSNETVIVHSHDTDIFVGLVYHAGQDKREYYHDNKKRSIFHNKDQFSF